jgi:hypothetical protein
MSEQPEREMERSDQIGVGEGTKLMNEPNYLSPAAECMRHHRQRGRDGLRYLIVELVETKSTLVQKGLLNGDARWKPPPQKFGGYAVTADVDGARWAQWRSQNCNENEPEKSFPAIAGGLLCGPRTSKS